MFSRLLTGRLLYGNGLLLCVLEAVAAAVLQINARTELALRYNDISPLENHHCSVAFEILEKPNANILRNTTPAQFKRIREGMIK